MEVMALSPIAGSSSTISRGEHLFGTRNLAGPSRVGTPGVQSPVKAYSVQGGNSQAFGLALDRAAQGSGLMNGVFDMTTFKRRRLRAVEAGAILSSSRAGVDDAAHLQEASLGELTRRDFPILDQEINGCQLVYLDNAATSQKPSVVLAALKNYYEQYNSNVHRGIHSLSAKATDEYELARSKIAKFLNASSSRDIVYTRNATEAINLVAYSWGMQNLSRGDEVVLSVAEHHSNIVPWQILSQKTGAVLKFASLASEEVVDLEELKGLITNKTKLVALHHVSNTLGSVNPIEEIVEWAHKYGAKVLVDACQSVPHMKVDVQALGADFLVASSHKMCGPTGMGILHAKSELLNSMPPFLGGGEMIADVFLEHSTYADSPSRFEAGTPAIGEAIALGAAVDYLTSVGMDRIHQYEVEMSHYLYESLSSIPSVRIYGPSPKSQRGRAALCAFNVEGMHATDVATFLDQQHGVAVRSGHHCTQPLHRYLGTNATARASLYFYNTKNDVDLFIKGLKDTIDFFRAFL